MLRALQAEQEKNSIAKQSNIRSATEIHILIIAIRSTDNLGVFLMNFTFHTRFKVKIINIFCRLIFAFFPHTQPVCSYRRKSTQVELDWQTCARV